MATYYVGSMPCSGELYHYGVKGMKWGKHLFGLAENVGQYVSGRGKQIYGKLTGTGTSIGDAKSVAETRRKIRGNMAGLREAASNTAYNARQFLTGSEDRKKMSDSRRAAENYRNNAKRFKQLGNYEMAAKYNDLARAADRQALKAQSEYESMTIPGMAEKTYRNVSNKLSKFGIDAKNAYDGIMNRVKSSSVYKKLSIGIGKVSEHILNGFASLCEKFGPRFAQAREWVTGSNARANLRSATEAYERDSSTSNLNRVVEADAAYRRTLPGAISGAYRDTKRKLTRR